MFHKQKNGARLLVFRFVHFYFKVRVCLEGNRWVKLGFEERNKIYALLRARLSKITQFEVK